MLLCEPSIGAMIFLNIIFDGSGGIYGYSGAGFISGAGCCLSCVPPCAGGICFSGGESVWIVRSVVCCLVTLWMLRVGVGSILSVV